MLWCMYELKADAGKQGHLVLTHIPVRMVARCCKANDGATLCIDRTRSVICGKLFKHTLLDYDMLDLEFACCVAWWRAAIDENDDDIDDIDDDDDDDDDDGDDDLFCSYMAWCLYDVLVL